MYEVEHVTRARSFLGARVREARGARAVVESERAARPTRQQCAGRSQPARGWARRAAQSASARLRLRRRTQEKRRAARGHWAGARGALDGANPSRPRHQPPHRVACARNARLRQTHYEYNTSSELSPRRLGENIFWKARPEVTSKKNEKSDPYVGAREASILVKQQQRKRQHYLRISSVACWMRLEASFESTCEATSEEARWSSSSVDGGSDKSRVLSGSSSRWSRRTWVLTRRGEPQRSSSQSFELPFGVGSNGFSSESVKGSGRAVEREINLERKRNGGSFPLPITSWSSTLSPLLDWESFTIRKWTFSPNVLFPDSMHLTNE